MCAQNMNEFLPKKNLIPPKKRETIPHNDVEIHIYTHNQHKNLFNIPFFKYEHIFMYHGMGSCALVSETISTHRQLFTVQTPLA